MEENLLEASKDLKQGQRLTFQCDDPTHTAVPEVEWFRSKHVKTKLPNQSPQIHPIQKLLEYLKADVQGLSTSDLT